MTEVIKLTVCLTVALYDISSTLSPSTPATSLLSALTTAVFTGDSWKLAVPAALYTLQSSLQYIAISNLDAATFQVTYQLQILTTALFSIALLGRPLSSRKWVALLLLALGIVIVQTSGGDSASMRDVQQRFFFPRSLSDLRTLGSASPAYLTKRSATYEGIQDDIMLEHPRMNGSAGLLAVIAACIVSGLAGVYFEKVLKDSSTSASLWVRNVQLSFYSLFPALFIGVVFVDGVEISKNGFFEGYNWVVWTVVCFQAFGGIVIAICMDYTDNVAKNLATSISILLNLIASIWLFEFKVTGTVSRDRPLPSES